VFDALVIGAGMAGLAATRRLRDAGRQVLCLEARGRVGGRAHSLTLANGARIDRGCHWLHSADINPLVAVAERLGFHVDRVEGRWTDPWLERLLGDGRFGDLMAFRAGIEEAKRAQLAQDADRPLAELAPSDSPWTPLWSAVVTYIWGALPAEVSALGHAADQDTGVNWRMALGYGSLVARYGEGLPVLLNAPVRRIAFTGEGVAVETAAGRQEARAVVLAVPASLLAAEAIAFAPGLPERKRWALEGLPLGSDNKVHFAVTGPTPWPAEEFHAHFTLNTERAGHFQFHPSGQPVVEGYYGGPLSRDLASAGEAAFADYALEEIVSHFGGEARRCLAFLHSTAWDLDPWSRGAYSYPRPGYAQARAALAEPLESRLFFAGEATSAEAPATCHGAYQSGLRAAEEILALS